MKWVSFIPATSRRLVIRAAQHDSEPVYLSGETGSGKSAIARWIHQNSPRGAKPLVLFAAGDDLAARALEAEDGTLVIQELENFSQAERAEIARFIKTRAIAGAANDSQTLRKMIRARVIATGTGPIREFSAFEPVFKEFRIHLPSLGERGVELDDIVDSLLNEMAHELKRDHVREISKAARAALHAHLWRANFRELRNILRFAILRTKGALIDEAHLPDLRDPDGLLLESREGFRPTEERLARESAARSSSR
jgi:two-component system response regulator FlrC